MHRDIQGIGGSGGEVFVGEGEDVVRLPLTERDRLHESEPWHFAGLTRDGEWVRIRRHWGAQCRRLSYSHIRVCDENETKALEAARLSGNLTFEPAGPAFFVAYLV